MPGKVGTYALTVHPQILHGTAQIRAQIVRVTDSGELNNPGCDWSYYDSHYQDFTVNAYVYGDRGEDYAIEEFSADYREPFNVDLKRAESMVKLLRKVQRGMDKINTAEGYVNDYASYVIRVARVLGIKTFYVRNDDRARARSGERWRKTDGYGLQYYVKAVAENRNRLYVYN